MVPHFLIRRFFSSPLSSLQISVQEVPQQQQPQGSNQDQLLLEAAAGRGGDVDNTNNNVNVDDSRFDVPTETSQSNNGGPGNSNSNNNRAAGAEILYPDGGAPNGAGAGLLNASDIFSTTASIDLDMKLRWEMFPMVVKTVSKVSNINISE